MSGNMFCCMKKESGFLALFIWDLIWMAVDFIIVVLILVQAGANFHEYRAGTVMLELCNFVFISLV